MTGIVGYLNKNVGKTKGLLPLMENEIIWYKSPNYGFHIGFHPSGSIYYNVTVDEIRISDIDRSEEWLSTCYNTMSNPLSFLNFGPEETSP